MAGTRCGSPARRRSSIAPCWGGGASASAASLRLPGRPGRVSGAGRIMRAMGLEHLHWFDLLHRPGTRRDFVRLGAGAVALVAAGGALPARRADAAPRFRSDPFDLGVASGDPLPDGVV